MSETNDMLEYFISTAIPNWHIHMISSHLSPLLLQKINIKWNLLNPKSKVGFLLSLIQPPHKRFPLELKPQAQELVALALQDEEPIRLIAHMIDSVIKHSHMDLYQLDSWSEDMNCILKELLEIPIGFYPQELAFCDVKVVESLGMSTIPSRDTSIYFKSHVPDKETRFKSYPVKTQDSLVVSMEVPLLKKRPSTLLVRKPSSAGMSKGPLSSKLTKSSKLNTDAKSKILDFEEISLLNKQANEESKKRELEKQLKIQEREDAKRQRRESKEKQQQFQIQLHMEQEQNKLQKIKDEHEQLERQKQLEQQQEKSLQDKKNSPKANTVPLITQANIAYVSKVIGDIKDVLDADLKIIHDFLNGFYSVRDEVKSIPLSHRVYVEDGFEKEETIYLNLNYKECKWSKTRKVVGL